jgi:hypothetical protein
MTIQRKLRDAEPTVVPEKEWVVDDDEDLFFYPKVRRQIFHCRLIVSDLVAWKKS